MKKAPSLATLYLGSEKRSSWSPFPDGIPLNTWLPPGSKCFRDTLSYSRKFQRKARRVRETSVMKVHREKKCVYVGMCV